MSYKADKYCRKVGPVGNGACRGFGHYNEPGYFDDYENFHPDLVQDDFYEREQREKQKEEQAELRQQKLEDEAEQRRREVQARSARQAAQPEPDPGLGALPVVAGIFAGIAAAKAAGERKRRMSPPPVAAPPQARPQPQPQPRLPKTGPSSVWDTLGPLLVLVILIAVGVTGVLALLGRVAWSRFFLTLGLGFLAFVLACFVSVMMERK